MGIKSSDRIQMGGICDFGHISMFHFSGPLEVH
jgi:hypothetical protein